MALAGPAATARLVLALPLVGILLGFALDVNPLAVLFATPVGLVALAFGVGMLALAWWWSRSLVRAAANGRPHAGLALALTGVAMRGGGAAHDARQAAVRALADAALAAVDDDETALLDEVLDLATRAGVPAAALLAAEAEAARQREYARAATAAERLGVTLMLPLGVCVLPAFGALAVIPLIVAILGRTVQSIGW